LQQNDGRVKIQDLVESKEDPLKEIRLGFNMGNFDVMKEKILEIVLAK
jgi:hypothetical protein